MYEDDGEFLVRLARKAVQRVLENGDIIKPPGQVNPELKKKSGVFVTLQTFPEKNLRGCIGLPEPNKPLVNAVIEAAISSAVNDPRFSPLTITELSSVTIEVTVLTPPELIKVDSPGDYLNFIKVGVHGLIIEKGWSRGLLLPQVPIEQGWNAEEYLRGLCMKAGLSPNAWMDPETNLYSFEGVVFSEEKPVGKVKKKP